MGKKSDISCKIYGIPYSLTLNELKLIENDLVKLIDMPPLKPSENFKRVHPNAKAGRRKIIIFYKNNFDYKKKCEGKLELSYLIEDYIAGEYPKMVPMNSKKYTHEELNKI